MFALFNLGGGELILIVALFMILFGAKRLPDIARRLGEELLDKEAREAGKSLGSIYGKPAAEALTPENQVAELYDPDVLRKNENERPKSGRFFRWARLRQWIRRLLAKINRRH